MRVEGSALVAARRNLRTECGYSVRSTATLRTGAQLNVKSAKGVWGKTRVFPHKQHIKSSRDYPPKQSGGLFRKHTTPLNYSFLSIKPNEPRQMSGFVFIFRFIPFSTLLPDPSLRQPPQEPDPLSKSAACLSQQVSRRPATEAVQHSRCRLYSQL